MMMTMMMMMSMVMTAILETYIMQSREKEMPIVEVHNYSPFHIFPHFLLDLQ